MNKLDYTILISSLLYCVVAFVIVTINDSIDEDVTFSALSDVNIILTHAFVIPSVVIMWKNKWYVTCLITSTIVSVFYHISKIYEWSFVDNMEIVDMAYQHVLLVLTGCIVIFKEIPFWIIPILIFTTTFIASFGMVAIGQIYLYEILLAIVLVLYIVFLLYRFCIYLTEDRNWIYVKISLLYGIVAGVSFFIAIYMTKYYRIMHSIWHVSAYALLYFSLRSLDIVNTYINNISTFSNVGTLAFKRRPRVKF